MTGSEKQTYGVPVGSVAGVSVFGCSVVAASDVGWVDIEESVDVVAAGGALSSVVLQALSDSAPTIVKA